MTESTIYVLYNIAEDRIYLTRRGATAWTYTTGVWPCTIKTLYYPDHIYWLDLGEL